MSRTRKGSKGPGWETWSRRPNVCCPHSRHIKKRTTRIERRDAKLRVERGETVDRQWDR